MANAFFDIGLIDALRYGAYLAQMQVQYVANGVPQDFYLPVSTAHISISRTAEFRRQGTITVELVPDNSGSNAPNTSNAASIASTPAGILSPFGAGAGVAPWPYNATAEVQLTMGLVDTAGINSAQIPLGLFTIAETQLQDSGVDLVVTLTVYDRSWVIAQRQLTNGYAFPSADGTLAGEIQALINRIWAQNPNAPPLQYNFIGNAQGTNVPVGSWQVPQATYDQGQDPWQMVIDLCTAAGAEVYFDINGVLTVKAMPDPTQAPVQWTFSDDTATAIALGSGSLSPGQNLDGVNFLSSPYTTPTAITVTLTRDGVANDYYVAAVGAMMANGSPEGEVGQSQAEAFDNTVGSPTYIRGPMGDVPNFSSTNLALSLQQAQAMANYNLFNQGISKGWQIAVTAPPNPLSSINGTPDPTNPSRLTGGAVRAWDIDDVFMVNRPDLGLNNVKVVVDTIYLTVRYDDAIQLAGRVIAGPGITSPLSIGTALQTISMDSTSDGGTLSNGAIVNTTLSAALTSGSNYTSIPVAATSGDIPSGSNLTLVHVATGNTQSLVTTSDSPSGSTSIAVQSFTANYSYASGDPVTYNSNLPQFTSLTSGLTSGTQYTSLSVNPTPSDLPSGSSITLLDSTTGLYQTVTTSGDTPANSTTINVTSFTANYSYASGDSVNYLATLTWDHTVSTSTNSILFVGVTGGTSSLGISSVTYNGQALTQLATVQVPSGPYAALYYLLNPPAGDFNIVVTNNGSASQLSGMSVSYVGTNGTIMDVSSKTATGVGTFTGPTINTSVVDSWAIGFFVTSFTDSAGDAMTAYNGVGGSGGYGASTLESSNGNGLAFISSGAALPLGPVALSAANPIPVGNSTYPTSNWACITCEIGALT